jgi:hypothetical protein
MPSTTEHPGFSGRVDYGSSSNGIDSFHELVADSRIEKLDSDYKEVKNEIQTVGVCNPKTMWEIAVQNIAAAVEYDAKVTADEAAAEMRGEDPEEPLPFNFRWPGKPLENVFAHGFFINLPVGGAKTLPSPDLFSATLGVLLQPFMCN